VKRLLALVLVLLAGCSRGATPQPQPQAPVPAPAWPEPVKTPVVVHEGGHVTVPGIKGWTVVATPDGSHVAFHTGDGIWRVSRDGSNLQQLVVGDMARVLVGLSDERVLYLEPVEGGARVAEARPGQAPRTVATVPVKQPEYVSGVHLWHHLQGDRLTLAGDDLPARQVNLTTGEVTVVDPEKYSIRWGMFVVAPDGQYLAYKRANRGEGLRILDLSAGTVAHTPGGNYAGYDWAPRGPQWAALAAPLGSGLPRLEGEEVVVGGTYVDLGGPDGQVRHLEPPVPLVFTKGPWWSPDGSRLALESEGSQKAVWVVEVATGRWQKLFEWTGNRWLAGWDRGSRHALVGEPGKQVRIPLDGGEIEAAPILYGEMQLRDGTWVYRPYDVTARDSVWIWRPGEAQGHELLGGTGTYDILMPLGMSSFAVVANQADGYKLIIIDVR